jgi:hypothetical protein
MTIPFAGHASRASGVRGQIGVNAARAVPEAISRMKRLPQPAVHSDTFCRRLVATPTGEAGAADARGVLFTNPPGYGVGPPFAEQTPL